VPGLRHTRFPFPSLKSYSALCGKRGAGQFLCYFLEQKDQQKGGLMKFVTLFPSQGKTLMFENITNMVVENGVLTFDSKKDKRSRETQKIITNLPFMCTENIAT
jgi:hypothetical protein